MGQKYGVENSKCSVPHTTAPLYMRACLRAELHTHEPDWPLPNKLGPKTL